MPKRLPLDIDAALLGGVSGVGFTMLMGYFKAVSPGILSWPAVLVVVGVMGVLGGGIGAVIAGRPDFGPTERAALLRGFLAAVPLYATAGLMFLPAEKWFVVLPILTIVASALVGPPIGIFVYRLYRRRDPRHEVPTDVDGGRLAWLKGELVGSWTPLLLSLALLAAFGLGIQVLPVEDLELGVLPPTPPTPAQLAARLPDLRDAVRTDSNDVRARYRLGVALTSVGRHDAAVAHLTSAVRLDSTRADAWRGLGRAAFYAGDHILAMEAYWEALNLDPGTLGTDGIDRAIWRALFAGALGQQRPRRLIRLP